MGKKAIAHAKSLKSQELLTWLRAERGRALIDNDPLQLPPYREMLKVIQQANFGYTNQVKQLPGGYGEVTKITPEVPPEATENQAFQLSEARFLDSPEAVLERILVAFDEEKSDDWIAKNIFLATGGNNYYRAKKRVAAIRACSGWNNQ